MEKYDFEIVKKYPPLPIYYSIAKVFYPSGNIKSISKIVGRTLLIGESIYYDEKGNITKRVNEDAKFGKIKIEDILKFLEKEGHIDLETGRGLQSAVIHENNWGEERNASFNIGLIKEQEKEYWMIIIYWGAGNQNTETIYHVDKDTGEVLHKESKKIGPIH